MANKKISELEELINVSNEDYIPIVDVSEGQTKKVNLENISENIFKNLEIIQPTINEDYVYSSDYMVHAYKLGNLVILNFKTVAFKQPLADSTVLFSGLPIPQVPPIFYLTGPNGKMARFIINPYGDMHLHYSAIDEYGDSANKQYFGTVVYLTND